MKKALTIEVLRAPSGRYLLRDGERLLWDSGSAVEELPAALRKAGGIPAPDYPPARLAELLLGLQACGRRISASVASRLAVLVKDKALTYSREQVHLFQGERKMASKKTAAVKKTAARKSAAPTAAKKPVKAAAAPATSKRGRAGAFASDARIQILVGENPKRGASAERFALYKSGMTVAKAMEAGVTAADLRNDTAKKFIQVEA